jgi:hypothetical protein
MLGEEFSAAMVQDYRRGAWHGSNPCPPEAPIQEAPIQEAPIQEAPIPEAPIPEAPIPDEG